MRIQLFDFQEDALASLHLKLSSARQAAKPENPQAVSFSAPTGAGKTIVMTALFEDILFGEPGFEAQPDAAILWISDIPELNEQTRLKIEGKSDRIRVKQLVTIDSTFDEEHLSGGCIYFINTQKLGTDKLLTQKRGDKRQYSIWETFTNTAQAIPDKFYIVIDEAHRGMKSGRGEEKAKTILQKFLLGSPDDGLCRMPLVVGVSATPKRFDDLIAGTPHTVHKVYVAPEDVRKSGLLKDRILIEFPDRDARAEMTLLTEAATRWKSMEKRWESYCTSQGEEIVYPILVVQVEDGTEKTLTKTNILTVLTTIESAIGRRLKDGEIAHTFHDTGDLEYDGRRLRRIEASRIEDEKSIRIVLFKMSLSTGWDCPRAEVMMSFRRASDHTYIAQLLGRMVRTPLARRIEMDATLNDVHLFLPYYDETTVEKVIKDLKNVEDVPPSETGTSRDLVILKRRDSAAAIFDAMKELITYRVNAVRHQSSIRRYIGLGRAITLDNIDEEAQSYVRGKVVDWMNTEVRLLQVSGTLSEKTRQVTGVDLRTIAVTYGTGVAEEKGTYNLEAVSADIERLFQQAGRLLGNGLHMDFWKSHADREANSVKVEMVILSQYHDGMSRLELLADAHFDELYEKNKAKIGKLAEQRRNQYEKLRLATTVPKDIPWYLPDTIGFRRSKGAPIYDKHIYIEDDGLFRADLGTWEREVLQDELRDRSVVGWLRNVDRKPWSLEIPYRDGATPRPMYPDLLIIRKVKADYNFDILEPHDPSLGDNYLKAIGLAEFGEKHGYLFDRIQMIRKKKGPDGKERYYRLDMGKQALRKKVLLITNNTQLDDLFEKDAI